MPARSVASSVPHPSPRRQRRDPIVQRPRRRLDHRGDDGQATVLLAALVGVALVLLVGLARLGGAAVDRAQARTAADAAALAGVVEEARGGGAGRRSATEVAAENGATLTGYEVDGTAVEVTVRVDDAQATSRAERLPTAGVRPGPSS